VARLVREQFQRKASFFDGLYDEDRSLQRRVRPAIFRRLELTLAAVRAHESPRVLDVGCGSGRVAEYALEAGAAAVVGIDFSERMLELAARRLERFGPRVEFVLGDFLEAPLEGPFDLALALGLFDYTAEPERIVRRMSELGPRAVIASFPRWDWLKGPIRKLRYEVIADCPIYDYTESGLRRLFAGAGFPSVEIIGRGRSDLVVWAEPAAETPGGETACLGREADRFRPVA
jgi:SAM-dependent methyltransferase